MCAYLFYFRYIIVNTNMFKFVQNFYSSSEIQNGIVQFYNKIASRLMNGIVYINYFEIIVGNQRLN